MSLSPFPFVMLVRWRSQRPVCGTAPDRCEGSVSYFRQAYFGDGREAASITFWLVLAHKFSADEID